MKAIKAGGYLFDPDLVTEWIADAVHHNLLWYPTSGQWFEWRDGRWVPIAESQAPSALWRALLKPAAVEAFGATPERQALYDALKARCHKWDWLVAVARALKHASRFRTPHQYMDMRTDQLNCPNGVVDLRFLTDGVYLHSPQFYHSHMTSAPFLPNIDTSELERWMCTVFSKPDADLLQRFLGTALGEPRLAPAVLAVQYGSCDALVSRLNGLLWTTVGTYMSVVHAERWDRLNLENVARVMRGTRLTAVWYNNRAGLTLTEVKRLSEPWIRVDVANTAIFQRRTCKYIIFGPAFTADNREVRSINVQSDCPIPACADDSMLPARMLKWMIEGLRKHRNEPEILEGTHGVSAD